MIKVLGVGGGAREHALAEKIRASKYSPRIYWIAEWRNPGISRICEQSGGAYFIGRTTDAALVSQKAKQLGVDMVVIGPEEPNFYGVVDAVEGAGVPCIGAKRELAVIEQSKASLRRLQWEYNLPGKLLFKTFTDLDSALSALQEASRSLSWMQNVVLKPARQAGGKGVKVVEDRQAYLINEKLSFKLGHTEWLMEYMRGYNDIEEKILVEENVWGPEYTLQAFSDGKTLVGMPLVQDNKHAFDFDIGPETGGMGSIAGPDMTLPFITEEEYDTSLKTVKAVVDAIQDRTGLEYRGFVAGQMMLTEVEGPTVIEMYSRLGDPEALNVLSMLGTDILDVLYAIIDSRLSKTIIRFNNVATVVKALAPEGYPDYKDAAKGHEVMVNEEDVERRGCRLYWGAAHLEAGRIVTTGSRTIELLGMSGTIMEAAKLVNNCLDIPQLRGWRFFYRYDIGTNELMKRRYKLAETVRRLYKFRASRGTLAVRVDWIPGRGLIDPSNEVLKNIA
ncbi:Phosphoribosylamine--glycine ligase [Candidatus Calditenuaceae archaeon HR02]|nr:Phosphoribosylamine--glycine ligase [Candidatus Calditenuaceae archaeon HR02]